jgi:hypothetical protein
VAVFVEASMGTDSANDVVGSRRNAVGLFDDEAEGMPNLGGTLPEESKGVSVAVNGAAMTEFEFKGRLGRGAPMEEVVFDGVAAGMPADGAANLVILEVRPLRACPAGP